MERTKNKFIIGIILAFITLPLYAIDKSAMLNAYLNGNMHYWQEQIDQTKRKTNLSRAESLVLLNYEYGYIGYLLGIKSDKQARYYLKDASARLDALKRVKNSAEAAQLEALSAAFTGYQIGLSPWKAPVLGPESIAYAEKAIGIQAEEPWGYIQMGNIKRYSPGIFGGSKQKALSYYLKAKILYEEVRGYADDWQYIALLMDIAQTYSETGDKQQAKTYYAAVKKAYPTFKWIEEAEK